MPQNFLGDKPVWGDMGVTEQLQLSETTVTAPNLNGGSVTRVLQHAGLLKKLRFYSQAQLDVVAGTGYAAPTKSAYGPLAGIQSIVLEVAGQGQIAKMTGLGWSVYNEVQNRDGSVLARSLNISELNIADSLKLAQFDAATGTGSFYAKYPFEISFSLPVSLRGLISELGLWVLQNQAVDMGINVTFNPIYSASASVDSPWSNATPGTGGSVAGNLAGTTVQFERELYNIPPDDSMLPNLAWAHQVIEYNSPFTGSFSRFNLPRSGLLLRAIIINLDGSGNLVEWTDVNSLSWVFGANDTPVTRKGQWIVQEFLQDYNRQPPKGVLVLDFYKWGMDGLKLVKDTEILANLRLETQFAATASGSQRIILDRLYPIRTTPQ